MFGVMKDCVKLVGVRGMQLEKGQVVKLRPSTNQPNINNFFASPADGKWSDGVERSDLDSILIEPSDLLQEYDLVEVLDPKHDDSLHCHAFLGIYVGVRNLNIQVEDQEGDCWEVSSDEISIPEEQYEIQNRL